MAVSDSRHETGARNQALFRDVNERIEEITDRDGYPRLEPRDFLCECANTECKATISLTRDEYEEIRRIPTRFPIARGHDDAEIERVVEETDRYVVVEKFGEGGVLAVELDPRRTSGDRTPRPS